MSRKAKVLWVCPVRFPSPAIMCGLIPYAAPSRWRQHSSSWCLNSSFFLIPRSRVTPQPKLRTMLSSEASSALPWAASTWPPPFSHFHSALLNSIILTVKANHLIFKLLFIKGHAFLQLIFLELNFPLLTLLSFSNSLGYKLQMYPHALKSQHFSLHCVPFSDSCFST